MTEKTKELLLKAKEAGYEKVTIFVADKRVPCSVKIRKCSTGWNIDETGLDEEGRFLTKRTGGYTYPGDFWGGTGNNNPLKVICATPDQFGDHPDLPGKTWPKIWGIIKRMGLGGSGSSQGHDIKPCFCEDFTSGYYEI